MPQEVEEEDNDHHRQELEKQDGPPPQVMVVVTIMMLKKKRKKKSWKFICGKMGKVGKARSHHHHPYIIIIILRIGSEVAVGGAGKEVGQGEGHPQEVVMGVGPEEGPLREEPLPWPVNIGVASRLM